MLCCARLPQMKQETQQNPRSTMWGTSRKKCDWPSVQKGDNIWCDTDNKDQGNGFIHRPGGLFWQDDQKLSKPIVSSTRSQPRMPQTSCTDTSPTKIFCKTCIWQIGWIQLLWDSPLVWSWAGGRRCGNPMDCIVGQLNHGIFVPGTQVDTLWSQKQAGSGSENRCLYRWYHHHQCKHTPKFNFYYRPDSTNAKQHNTMEQAAWSKQRGSKPIQMHLGPFPVDQLEWNTHYGRGEERNIHPKKYRNLEQKPNRYQNSTQPQPTDTWGCRCQWMATATRN